MLGLIGGLVSAGTGLASQNKSNEASHSAITNAKKALEGTEGYADALYNNGQSVLSQMLQANQNIYGNPQQAAQALQTAQQSLNSVDPYKSTEFSYDKSIDDFYDKALGLRMNAANDAINQSQALGGALFSSDTANKLTAQAQVLGSQAYNDALAAYQTDKGLEQSIWQGNESAKQAEANSNLGIAQSKYNMASDTASNISNAQNSYYDALMGLNSDYYQNKSDYASALAQLEAQDPGHTSWWSRTFDPAGFFGIS